MKQVIFIRHAEKSKHGKHLNDVGYLRSIYLTDYFLHPFGNFEIPEFAYVMCLDKKSKSVRCLETMQPTIDKGMPYELVSREHTHKLAKTLRNYGYNIVVICWEHSRIVDIVNLLIGHRSINAWGFNPDADDDDKNCFDATWVCTLDETSLTLKIYRQFDIVDGQPKYLHDRNKIIFERKFYITTFSCVVT